MTTKAPYIPFTREQLEVMLPEEMKALSDEAAIKIVQDCDEHEEHLVCVRGEFYDASDI